MIQVAEILTALIVGFVIGFVVGHDRAWAALMERKK